MLCLVLGAHWGPQAGALHPELQSRVSADTQLCGLLQKLRVWHHYSRWWQQQRVVGRVSAALHCDLEPQEGICSPVRTPPYPLLTDENLIKQPRPPAAGKSSSPRSILSSENQAFLCLVPFFWLKQHHTGQREPHGGPRRVTPHHISPQSQTLTFPRVTTILTILIICPCFVSLLYHTSRNP